MEDNLFYNEQTYQIINNIQELDFLFSKKTCDQVQTLTVTFVKENLKKLIQLQSLQNLMPKIKEIYLDLSYNDLNNTFLIELQNCLICLKYLQSANIKLIQNQFTYQQSKKFIIYIQNRFQIKDDIECSYKNKQISYACGKSSISFNHDFNKSTLIKEGLTKSMKIIIPKDQDEFKAFINKCLKQEVENLQVIIYYNNQKIAVCQSNCNCSLLVNLHFEDMCDIQDYIYSHHDMVHISFNSNNILFLNLTQFDKYPHFRLELNNGEVDLLLFQNLRHTEKQQKFIQKQILDQRITQLNNIYFQNNSDVQFAKLYILPKILLEDGKLIQNTISFYFIKERDENNIFVQFDTMKKLEQQNERKISFYFFDINLMIKVFNAIFSLLQNSQLILYKLDLFQYQGKQITQQNEYFFFNMVDKNIEYNIQILNVNESKHFINNSYKSTLIIPIIEEVKSLKEMYIKSNNLTKFEIFLDDNIKYFQRNKQKSLYHLILDFSCYSYGKNHQKCQKQYSINNIHGISMSRSKFPLQHFNVSKCKRLVFLNKTIKRNIIDDDYYNEDYDDYSNYTSESDEDDDEEEILKFKDVTYIYK